MGEWEAFGLPIWAQIIIGVPIGVIEIAALLWVLKRRGMRFPINLTFDGGAEQRGWERGYVDGYMDCKADRAPYEGRENRDGQERSDG